MCTRIVERTSVNSQMIVVETRIHRALSCSYPYTVLILAQHRTATTAKAQADDDRLSIWSYHTEAGITLAIHLRILLSWLIHGIRTEVLLRLCIV